jgi:hypothetical protein
MIPDRKPPEYRVVRPTETAGAWAGKRLVPQRLWHRQGAGGWNSEGRCCLQGCRPLRAAKGLEVARKQARATLGATRCAANKTFELPNPLGSIYPVDYRSLTGLSNRMGLNWRRAFSWFSRRCGGMGRVLGIP